MSMQDKQKEMADEIKKGLKDRNISQPVFCKSFLHEYYADLIDELEMENHYDRFKKVLRLERKCEMIALYYSFYKRKYLSEKVMSDEARKAAYTFYIEMDTRIVTQPLKDGLDKDALSSLYQLFKEWREISKKNGFDSQNFYEHSKKYMNEVLRPFLSKWRKVESKFIECDLFREELKALQGKTSNYIERLKHDFNFADG